jgi:hypothetical protein
VGLRRLTRLREEVPDLPVLGIDEHTALVIDPDTSQGTVHGQGAVHVLVGDDEQHVPTGGSLDLADALGRSGSLTVGENLGAAQHELAKALEQQDPAAVVSALGQDLDLDRAALVAALEPVLERGWTSPDVSLLLEARQKARADKQWALSDLLRDGLAALGVVVEDTADGQRVRDLKN